MTRTELKSVLEGWKLKDPKRLYRCNATVYGPENVEVNGKVRPTYMLRSYWTNVAIGYFDDELNKFVVYELGYYSPTTTRQVYRFANWLCEKCNTDRYAYTVRRTYLYSAMKKAERQAALECDFEC